MLLKKPFVDFISPYLLLFELVVIGNQLKWLEKGLRGTRLERFIGDELSIERLGNHLDVDRRLKIRIL